MESLAAREMLGIVAASTDIVRTSIKQREMITCSPLEWGPLSNEVFICSNYLDLNSSSLVCGLGEVTQPTLMAILIRTRDGALKSHLIPA